MAKIVITSEIQQQQQQKQLSLGFSVKDGFKLLHFKLWIDGIECVYVGVRAPHQHLSIYYYSTCVCIFFKGCISRLISASHC